MNRKLILRLLGAILSIEALAMIPSFLIALRFGDGDALLLGLCALALLIPGLLLWFTVHPQSGSHLRLIEGFIIVAVINNNYSEILNTLWCSALCVTFFCKIS